MGTRWGKGASRRECRCTSTQIQKYRSRISGPLLDRIDLHLEVPAVDYEKLADSRRGESSEIVRERVMMARKRQEQRFQDSQTNSNSGMNRQELEVHAQPSEGSKNCWKMPCSEGLSARAYDRILKVARTIADLDGADSIDTPHVAEAIQYRNLDRPA